MQHDRGSCDRAGERNLLKWYNSKRRGDRLSNKLLSTTEGGHSKVRTYEQVCKSVVVYAPGDL